MMWNVEYSSCFSISIIVLDYLLYWIIYCTGLAVSFWSLSFLVSSSYCLIHCFTIIMVAVVAVWPSLSSLVDLDPYVLRVRLIVYWFDYGTAPMSLLLLLLIFYNLIYYYYYFKSRLPIILIRIGMNGRFEITIIIN